MTIDNPLRMVREMKGAPLSILVSLSIVRQAVSAKWLVAVTGYSPNTVSSALITLQEAELAVCDRRRSYWQLTGDAKQLPLMAGLDHPDLKNCDLDRKNCDQDGAGPCVQPENSEPDLKNCDLDRENCDLEMDGTGENGGNIKNDLKNCDLDRENCDQESLDLDLVKIDRSTDLDSRLSRLAVPEILQAAQSLLGKSIRGHPSEYPDPRLLLAWIAHAYDNRGNGKGKTHSPAGLIYWAFHAGQGKAQIDPNYLADPIQYLPDEFLEEIGLLTNAEVPVLEEPQSDEQRAWLAVRDQVVQENPLARPYLTGAELAECTGDLFVVRASNPFARDWLDSRLSSTITRLLSGITGRSCQVRIV